jgi:hypothetical protein
MVFAQKVLAPESDNQLTNWALQQARQSLANSV